METAESVFNYLRPLFFLYVREVVVVDVVIWVHADHFLNRRRTHDVDDFDDMV